jgi:hypothetical protein
MEPWLELDAAWAMPETLMPVAMSTPASFT